MKKLALLFSFALVAGVAGAQDAKPAAQPAKAAVADKAAPAKTHDVQAEVVSFDAAKSTLTIKADTETKGVMTDKTVPVEGKAIAALKNVKPGAKVTLVCKDDSAGMHQAVVDVKTSK
ncbi:MAG: hypothetical protein ABW221_10375 [Vicinamibacteria bacterium]